MVRKVPKVWIADDDEAIRMVLEEGLKSAGLEIATFADGESLIDALNDEKPDLCLLYTSPSPRDKRQSRMPSSA